MTKIAIIGSSGLFPGSSTPEEFWENLMTSQDLTDLATEEDFGANPELFFDPQKGVVDRCYSLRGGYIRDFEFDSEGYELPSEFLANQDKLYQWSLFVAREALRDSGYLADKKALSTCGLILGNLSFPTGSSHRLLSSIYSNALSTSVSKLLGEEFSIIPHHKKQPKNEVLEYTPSQLVTKALGLSSNHYALDAACASSLYAIKLACDELVTGKADLMLAGAVCASDQLFIHMGFSIFHAYAPADKLFAPLDKNSAGLVSSEGAGMVTLKRLADAERDGDHILAVIGGIGLSNDGRGKFLLSPNPKGQRLAFERAYSEDVLPGNTSYLECHATGTPLGDITELNSISDYFKMHNTKPLLGSVKSNMGHLLTAAGMTGLLKVLLAMQKGVIPPNINLKEPIIAPGEWIGSDQMIIEPMPWEGTRNQAGINSFGFGGTNAHMIVQKYAEDAVSQETASNPMDMVPMAIIGMDAHFGKCKNLREFYDAIYQSQQDFHSLPEARWKGFEENKALLESHGFENGLPPKGAYIADFEIDLLRYKIQPTEAETLEAQQALILKVTDNAIIDSGLEESQNIAVLIAMESELAIHHYLARWDVTWQLKEALDKTGIQLSSEKESELEELLKDSLYYREGSQTPSQHTSFVGNIMASRIAALWDFSGPAFTVSCGDNSVFKAIQIAQNMLSLGEVDAVVVGGVDLAGGLENVLLRNVQDKINTSERPSLSLNKEGDGWLVGEGAGAIVLKKKSEAPSDRIYAVIDGIGNKGEIGQIDYLELADTGIRKQDEQELNFLMRNAPDSPVALGSIKANFGHTNAASGIASLIKTALCVHQRFIPGIPNWDEPKDVGAFQNKKYYFPTASRPWILQDGKSTRKASINGPDDLQIQLSESTVTRPRNLGLASHNPLKLFALSANTEVELSKKLDALEIALESNNILSEIANSFHLTYEENKGIYTIAILGKEKANLLKDVLYFKKNLPSAIKDAHPLKTPSGSYFTPAPLGADSRVAYIYPGSATAYPGLGSDLFQLFPELYTHFEEMGLELDRFMWSDYLYPKQIAKSDKGPDIYQDAIAMMSVGVFFSATYTELLQSVLQCQPDIAFGYSMGECSSMWYSLGVWGPHETREFQDSPIFKNRFAGDLQLLADHWKISVEDAKARWISLVLLAHKDEVQPLVEKENHVYLTFINTSDEVVISGDREACLRVANQLSCNAVPIPFQNVIHHDFCKQEDEGLLRMHCFPIKERPDIDFYSSITKEKLTLDSQILSENSTAVCCTSVDFPSIVNRVYDANARIFIEVGANATCTKWIQHILEDKPSAAVAIDQKGKSEIQSILELIAQMISHGKNIDLRSLYPAAELTSKKPSFFKKIIVGGKRIYETILSVDNIASFARPNQLEVSTTAAVASTAKQRSWIGTSDNLTASFPSAPQTINPLKSNSYMEPQIISYDKSKDSSITLAENGLPIYDFATGEQLQGKEIIFSQQDLETFSTGKISDVFGDDFAIIDTYSRRVMLPMYPYLLVSRVTGLDAKIGEYKASTMQTEYDIPHNAWFTTDRQIPWAVSVESGQCDLLLISYLGIDFENKGNLVYRLLDCTLTFVDDLPFEGQTLRYDISINSFVRNGENLLFFFSYRCYVEDRLVLKMDGGCAGFFKDEQLVDGKGVVYTESEMAVRTNADKKLFTPLLKSAKTSFSKEDLLHLINGDLEKCFDDESYFANGRNPSLCLPPEKMLMLDRITSVDLRGGAYGLGYIIAEKDLHPNDWYFPCHFRDDEVLAGSLQAEGGGNLLRFFMLMLGLQRLTKDARYQPLFDLPQKVRCRKQVTPKDTKLIYKLEIKEIGLIPNPYVIGDLEIISDGIVTVHFENLGLQLREKTNPKYLDNNTGIEIPARSEGALMNEKDITTFALDDLSACFGPDFAVYDGRTVSRQPNTDLQLISRVLSVDGKRGDFSKPSTILAEYDVPVDAWYYTQNASPTMPYSILMEIALQPCGLLGAYLGSTLQFPDKNLFFRNLDGEGETFDLPIGTDFRGKTISNKSVLVSSVALGGTVLQNYTFELSIEGKVFYAGKSSFGFFPGEALASQVGLDNGKEVAPWFETEQLSTGDFMQVKLDSLYGKMKLYKAPVEKPYYRLAENQLNMLDKLIISRDKGQYGKGYIHATKFVKTYDWFFTCHFYQDPVMPGSLGVEGILQAIQVFALQQDLGKEFRSPRFVQLQNNKTKWKYRGQILLGVKEMHLEAHIKSIEHLNGQVAIIADAYLWNEKMRIYQITDLALGIEEA